MPKTRTSARKRIIEVLSSHLALTDDSMTAIEIKRKIPEYSLRTISSTLAKMTKRGVLWRKKGVGPQGGYGYNLRSIIDLQGDALGHALHHLRLQIDRKILEGLWPTT